MASRNPKTRDRKGHSKCPKGVKRPLHRREISDQWVRDFLKHLEIHSQAKNWSPAHRGPNTGPGSGKAWPRERGHRTKQQGFQVTRDRRQRVQRVRNESAGGQETTEAHDNHHCQRHGGQPGKYQRDRPTQGLPTDLGNTGT